MRVYKAIVRALESLGVDAVFGGPGENDATLLLALKHSTRIKPVIVRNEQAASFMACGYAMYANRLGVCFATAGPGAFNLFSGLAVALSDSHPVLAISGFASLDWKGKGALNESSGLSRTPDSQAMFAATTKKSYLLTDPAQTCDVLEEAVNLAFEGRPGPVHIHVPENLTHPGGRSRKLPRDPALDVRPVLPDPGQLAAAANALALGDPAAETCARPDRFRSDAKAGRGPSSSPGGAVQIPFVTTLDGKGIIRENHPLAWVILGDSGNRGAREAFNHSRGRRGRRQLVRPARELRLLPRPASRARRSFMSTSTPTRSTRSTRPTIRSSPTRSPPSRHSTSSSIARTCRSRRPGSSRTGTRRS